MKLLNKTASRTALASILMTAVLIAPAAMASSVTMYYGTEFTDSKHAPGSMEKALMAVFKDNGDDTVTLTITNNLRTLTSATWDDQAFVTDWYFNVNGITPSLLYVEPVGVDWDDDLEISLSSSGHKGPGKGFELAFSWVPSYKFAGGETATFLISAPKNESGVSVSAFGGFDDESARYNSDEYTSAVHVQGLMGSLGVSGWYGAGVKDLFSSANPNDSTDGDSGIDTGVVPEPTTMVLLSLGLAGLAVRMKRRILP